MRFGRRRPRRPPLAAGTPRRLLQRVGVGTGWFILLFGLLLVAGVLVTAERTRPGSELQSRLGTREARFGIYPVALDEVAPLMRSAVVDTEDERFYSHQGVDVIGVLRAAPYDLVHLSLSQGASTLTEQLAKILYLGGSDHSFSGKLKAAVLAFKIERHNSKAQILASYLNCVYFGDGAYGVRAAARRYFGLAPSQLGLAQASLLAGLIQAPSAYDPYHSPSGARVRQAEVLRSMVRNGDATLAGAEAVMRNPLHLRGHISLAPLAEKLGVRGQSHPAQLLLGGFLLAAGIPCALLAKGSKVALAWRATGLLACVLGLLELVAGVAL